MDLMNSDSPHGSDEDHNESDSSLDRSDSGSDSSVRRSDDENLFDKIEDEWMLLYQATLAAHNSRDFFTSH